MADSIQEFPKRHGITYWGIFNRLPKWLSDRIFNGWARWICPKGIHLLDEVVDSERNHYLVCDACSLAVYISRIEEWTGS